MQASKELELDPESVKITWCVCEVCNALGPRYMTVVRNRHEVTVQLNDHCRGHDVEEALVCGEETLNSAGRPPLRNQLPR
jgi:hypothetical protein